MNGIIIAFEGVDGAGKTSQIRLLNEYFDSKNYKHTLIKGHPAFDGVKEKILDIDKMVDPFSLFLLSMVKFKSIATKLSDMRKEYDYIILDRYIDTAISYSLANISSLEFSTLYSVISLLKNVFVTPDITIFINTPVEVALQRKNNNFDRIELGNHILSDIKSALFLKNQNKALEYYRNIILSDPNKYITIDGSKLKSEISKDIINSLKKKKLLS